MKPLPIELLALSMVALFVPFREGSASTTSLFPPPQGGPHAAYEEGSSRYSYDRNGNLIRREEKTSGIVTRRYRYTTTGHLQKQDLTDHIYDAEGNKLASVLRDGTIASYLEGTRFKQGARGEIPKVLLSFGDAELSEQQELQFFLTDHLSSVTAMANRSGLEEVKDHQPYGQSLFLKTSSLPSGERTEYDFTGNELQDDHLDYRARQMVPGEARFLQADPTIPNLQLPLAYNRYAYVYNNPVSFDDPTGKAPSSQNLAKILRILSESFGRIAEVLENERSAEIVESAGAKEVNGGIRGERWALHELIVELNEAHKRAPGHGEFGLASTPTGFGPHIRQELRDAGYNVDLREIADVLNSRLGLPLPPEAPPVAAEVTTTAVTEVAQGSNPPPSSSGIVPRIPPGSLPLIRSKGLGSSARVEDLPPEYLAYFVDLYWRSNASPRTAGELFAKDQGWAISPLQFQMKKVWGSSGLLVGNELYPPELMKQWFLEADGPSAVARSWSRHFAPLTRDGATMWKVLRDQGLQKDGTQNGGK